MLAGCHQGPQRDFTDGVALGGQQQVQRLQGEQGHLRIVADHQLAAVQHGLLQALRAVFALNGGPAVELDFITEGIAHGPAKHAAQHAGGGGIRIGADGARELAYMLLLRAGFDGALALRTHGGNGVGGRPAQLHQQARGDGAAAAQAPTAMHQHIAPLAQMVAQAQPGIDPGCLEIGVRHVHIGDGQVVPLHAARLAGHANVLGLHKVQLFHRHQRDDGGRSPIEEGVQVDVHIALPLAGYGIGLLFTGADGEAYRPQTGTDGQVAQLQRAVVAGEDAC